MNPETQGAAETIRSSEPLKEGVGMATGGGATAPMQNAEQALQVGCPA